MRVVGRFRYWVRKARRWLAEKIMPNEWHHIEATYDGGDGSGLKVYVDGEELGREGAARKDQPFSVSFWLK